MDSELNEGEVTTTAERRATTGLVMCGGEGTRLRPAVGDTEKPLVEIDGEPMIDRVVAALQASSLTTVAAGVSPATPETAAHLTEIDGVDCIETAGDGYVADLSEAVGRLTTPVVTVAADLPLVAADHVDRAAATAGEESLTVCVPVSLTTALGVSAETTTEHDGTTVVPTGLNVVGSEDGQTAVWEDSRLAFNVNRPGDIDAVERWVDRRDRTNR
jgi:adenosylcobinamide-phosphate guanylyltransferase